MRVWGLEGILPEMHAHGVHAEAFRLGLAVGNSRSAAAFSAARHSDLQELRAQMESTLVMTGIAILFHRISSHLKTGIFAVQRIPRSIFQKLFLSFLIYTLFVGRASAEMSDGGRCYSFQNFGKGVSQLNENTYAMRNKCIGIAEMEVDGTIILRLSLN